jgi:hypothetical protein
MPPSRWYAALDMSMSVNSAMNVMALELVFERVMERPNMPMT